MVALRLVLVALAVLFVIATALPLVRSSQWWVRMFDFPRMQIAVASVVVLVLYGVLVVWTGEPTGAEWVLFAALVVAVAYQGVRMLPYTRLYPEQVRLADPVVANEDRRFRLVVSNVLMENREGERWLDEIRAADPDVVVAVEADGWWAETLRQLGDAYPHRVEQPQDDTYGMLVHSRLAFDSVEVRHLVEPEVPSLFLTARLRSGEPVSLVFLHPRPPRPDIQQDSHLRDAELVLAGRDVAQREGPIVVAGDLNDVAWSHTTNLFQELSELLDPRIGRGTFSTFDARRWWLRYPLDHVFHSDHFALVELRRLGAVGSDHFPILIELELNPAVAPLQEGPDVSRDEIEEGDAMVAEAAERKAKETDTEHQERVQEDQ